MISSSSTDRRNTAWIGAGVVGVLAVLAVIVFPRIVPHRPRPVEKLKDFEGVIDHSKQTYDHIKSDLYIRASHALEAGDGRSAEALYKEVIVKYPKDPDGYGALGACLFVQERYDEARAEYLRALELSSRSVSALYGLGCVAYKQGRSIEARDYLEKALVIDQENGLCHRVLGSVYEQLGDVQRAVSHYDRAIALDPSVAGDTVIRERLKDLRH